MKRLVIVVLAGVLSGCVGASFVSNNEGLYLEHPGNQSKRNEYRFPDYSSLGDGDPGNPVVLTNGVEVSTDCYSETLLSFMPSIIVPLPPVLPWFPSDPKWSDELVVLVKGRGLIENVVLESSGRQLFPTELRPGAYRFDISCANIKDYPTILQFSHDGRVESIKLLYKKIRNFGWFWIGAALTLTIAST